MIDWLTVRVPVSLPRPIDGGFTVKLDRSGEVIQRTPHRLMVSGSFESTISVRAPSTSELEISGNPIKWLQGHNLYGTNDPKKLLWAALQRLQTVDGVFPCSLAEMGLETPESLNSAIVTRIDCTAMLSLPTASDVLAFIRGAHATGHLTHRGRGVLKEGTLVFGHAGGRNFARWQIVLYSKGQETTAHPLPHFMMQDREVLDWVNRCLRVEVRLGRLELGKKGLRALGNWTDDMAAKIWTEKVSCIDFNESKKAFDFSALPVKLRPIFVAWTTGEDVRQMCSRATFYRYRQTIQELAGVDIAVPPPKVPTAEIVPFRRTLEAIPVGRPIWAERIDAELRAAGAVVLDAAA